MPAPPLLLSLAVVCIFLTELSSQGKSTGNSYRYCKIQMNLSLSVSYSTGFRKSSLKYFPDIPKNQPCLSVSICPAVDTQIANRTVALLGQHLLSCSLGKTTSETPHDTGAELS